MRAAALARYTLAHMMYSAEKHPACVAWPTKRSTSSSGQLGAIRRWASMARPFAACAWLGQPHPMGWPAGASRIESGEMGRRASSSASSCSASSCSAS